MPRLKVSDTEMKNREAKAILTGAMELRGLDKQMLAVKTHIKQPTLYKRFREPDTFLRKELMAICKVLSLSDEEKAKLL